MLFDFRCYCLMDSFIYLIFKDNTLFILVLDSYENIHFLIRIVSQLFNHFKKRCLLCFSLLFLHLNRAFKSSQAVTKGISFLNIMYHFCVTLSVLLCI